MPDTPTSPPEDVIRSGALVRLSDGASAIVGETDGLVALCARVEQSGRISEDEKPYLLSALVLLTPAPLAAADKMAKASIVNTFSKDDLDFELTVGEPAWTRRDRAAHAALIALGSAGVSADDMKRDPEWYAEVAYMLADAMERAATAQRTGEAAR